MGLRCCKDKGDYKVDMMKTLTQVQEAAITKLDQPRSSLRRYQKYSGSVYRWYRQQLTSIGYTDLATIRDTWRDVTETLNLRRNAE